MASHVWLILADSALPIGSFAFSSSLESYAQHQDIGIPPREKVMGFVTISLQSVAATILPFVTAAYALYGSAAVLDDEYDATVTCSVAYRASITQGKALMTVWDKSLSSLAIGERELVHMTEYRAAIRTGHASGHFGVTWGIVCRSAGLDLGDVLYVFMFNHLKAVLSAAVRLGLIGPYHAQRILALDGIQKLLGEVVEEGKGRCPGMAGQTAPTLDLYQGRHELLYSRVFNS